MGAIHELSNPTEGGGRGWPPIDYSIMSWPNDYIREVRQMVIVNQKSGSGGKLDFLKCIQRLDINAKCIFQAFKSD